MCGHGLYGPTVVFWNFGWSAAEDATLRLAFTSPGSTETPSRFDVSKSLGRVDKTATTDLEPELRAAGVNTALLKSRADRTLSCQVKDEKRCLAELKASGIFGSLARLITDEPAVRAVGTLEYDWIDGKGNKKKRSSKIDGQLQLGRLSPGPTACAEDAAPETPAPRPVSFRLDAVPIPASDHRSTASHSGRPDQLAELAGGRRKVVAARIQGGGADGRRQ